MSRWMAPVRWWNGYVDFWREREAPDAYAVARITWGLAVAGNIVHQMLFPGVVTLYALPEHGGTFGWNGPPFYSLFQFFDPTAEAVTALAIANLVFALMLTAGAATRLSALALMAIHITLVGRLSLYGFGGDIVVRVFSFLMVLAPLGASWSVDAWLLGGRRFVPVWPRRLVIAQLTFLYVKTGIVKLGAQWSFSGGHSAVYYALNDPSFARVDGSWLAWVFPLTQIGTFVTRWWETLFFLLPWSMYLRRPKDRPGLLRKTLGRFDLRLPMLGVGAILHLTLFATMDLGMFPWVTMALYAFFLKPSEARWLLTRVLPERLRFVSDEVAAPEAAPVDAPADPVPDAPEPA